MTDSLSSPPRYLDSQAAADLYGVSTKTLEKWRQNGFGPPFVKLGKAVRYERAALLAWAEARTVRSTTEAALRADAEQEGKPNG